MQVKLLSIIMIDGQTLKIFSDESSEILYKKIIMML